MAIKATLVLSEILTPSIIFIATDSSIRAPPTPARPLTSSSQLKSANFTSASDIMFTASAIAIIARLALIVPLALNLESVLVKDLKPEFKLAISNRTVTNEYAICSGSSSAIFRKDEVKRVTAAAIPTRDATWIPSENPSKVS